MKITGFISHIHEESSIAEYVKCFLEEEFLGQLSLFVSSTDLRAGKWMSQIEDVLRQSSFVFPLLSQASVSRPWINFESGCAFIKDNVYLVPLCHGNLTPSRLGFPYASFQIYDLNDENSVSSLMRFIAGEMGMRVPKSDLSSFCANIVSLSRVVDPVILDINDLKRIQELQDHQWISDNPEPIEINQLEVWDDLKLRAKTTVDKKVLEISGFSSSSMGVSIKNLHIPDNSKYLLIEIDKSETAESKDFDKLMKVAFDRNTAISVISDHRHPIDSDYILKLNGFFVYEIPTMNRENNLVETLELVFWKIALQSLVLKLFFV
jgi:TIR domain